MTQENELKMSMARILAMGSKLADQLGISEELIAEDNSPVPFSVSMSRIIERQAISRKFDMPVGRHEKGFRRAIGTYRGQPRRFWFGHDEKLARSIASTVYHYHADCQFQWGMTDWTDEALEHARRIIEDAKATHLGEVLQARTLLADAPQSKIVETKPVAPVGYSLTTAIEDYRAHLGRKVLANNNRHRKLASMTLLEKSAKAQGVDLQADVRAAVNRVEIEKIISTVTSRPKTKFSNRMSVHTVKNSVGHWSEFFTWLDESGKWAEPKNMYKLFRVTKESLRTEEEVRASTDGKAVYRLDELSAIYAKANERQRLYILMGLNCAFWQKDASRLVKGDIKGNVIDRIRYKTHRAAVRGRWDLWPTTAAAIRENIAGDNPSCLAFLTEDGNPIVNDAVRSDSVAQSWRRLIDDVNEIKPVVSDLPFGTLRTTAGDAILRLSGGNEYVKQLMLCQSSKTVAGKHYAGKIDFTPLVEPLHKWGLELQAAGIPLGLKV